MENPWGKFSLKKRESYVLSCEKEVIEDYNEGKKKSEENRVQRANKKYRSRKKSRRQQSLPHYIDLRYYPEPFIGHPDAPIYLLIANPGRMEKLKEDDFLKKMKKCPDFKYAITKNLNGKHCGNYYLDMGIDFVKNITDVDKKKNKKGNADDEKNKNWWFPKFTKLKESLGYSGSEFFLSKYFFVLETHGYHSKNFDDSLIIGNDSKIKLTSVKYTQFLLHEAIKTKKLILVCRSVGTWYELDSIYKKDEINCKTPKLENYDNCFLVASNRGIQLTKTTISPKAFKMIKDIINSYKFPCQ